MKPLRRAIDGLLVAAEAGRNAQAKELATLLRVAGQKRVRGRPPADAPQPDNLLRELASLALKHGKPETRSLARQVLRGMQPRERGEHAALLVDTNDPLVAFVVWDGLNEPGGRLTTRTAIANMLADMLGSNRKTVAPLVDALIDEIKPRGVKKPLAKPQQGVTTHRCR